MSEHIVKAPNVPPFVTFVTSAVPMVFDNSLSYYEALCALWKWLQDDVVNVINNNATVTEDYINLTNELKTFVEDYFDNLDVQEEINNKLDEMAEDGSLQEILTPIVTQYIQTEVAWSFDNVAAMKASTDLVNNSYAHTLGYYSISDGGEAYYKIRTKASGETIDEMYKIAIGDDLVADLVIGTELHSKQLGLKGDGITNETDKLNAFLDTPVQYKRVLDDGVYLTNATIYIKGMWRQDSGNNGVKDIVFNNATFKYTGSDSNAAIVVYNHFMSKISNLSISRDGNKGYVEVVGCWHLSCSNWDIYDLKLTNSNSNLTGKSISTKDNEYISFDHCYIKGQLSIPTVNGQFTNCINFYNSLIGSNNKTYCVELSGAKTHQQINFFFSDLSYATDSIFNVADTQTDKGSVTCYGCYFDSSKPIFKNNNKNGLRFDNIFSTIIANTNEEIVNIKYSDFINTTNLVSYSNRGSNLGGGDCNLAINGDLSSTTESGHNENWYSWTNTNWTKSYEDSGLGLNGKCRKLQYIGGGTSANFRASAVTAPRDDYYTFYIRLKVISGSFNTIQSDVGGHYAAYSFSQVGNNEVVLVNSKDNFFTAGSSLNTTIYITGIGNSEDLVLEIYEVGMLEGKFVKFNQPLVLGAKLN